VNSYRDPDGTLSAPLALGSVFGAARREESEFPRLLERIVEGVPALARLRYTSPHPRHLTDALIDAHASLAPLVRHVHLPVQSGSDRVLRRMIRRYTIEDYEARVERLRARVPGVTLSTDVIVGFPGETREDFEATLALVERMRFAQLFGFMYSVRPYTPARKLEDDVSEEEKGERLAELFELSERHRQEHLATLIGRAEPVLVEGRGRGGSAFMGRTERNEIVHFESADDPTGLLVDVRIERAFKNSLFGSRAGAPAASLPARVGPAPRRALPVFAG
jgi:tRNA-2-methylthio-N6-dimethylallyladenosine synthase